MKRLANIIRQRKFFAQTDKDAFKTRRSKGCRLKEAAAKFIKLSFADFLSE
jgi:hypothetical protein